MIQVSAFRWVPAFAQGYVRDLRVRWALEEAGLAYQTVLIDAAVQNSAGYRRWQPFGQVPAYRDGEVEIFESGAIVLHVAARSVALMPQDAAGRARVMTWVLAALNSIEPATRNLIDIEDSGDAWPQAPRARAEALVNERLASLSAWLGANDYLEKQFSAGDLMMTTVLRELGDSPILAKFPTLAAYFRRCEARPAFVRALAAQMRDFQDNAPA
jgi:glutathione S-transferase